MLSIGVVSPKNVIKNMTLAKELDPSLKEYKYPDFGFSDNLNFE